MINSFFHPHNLNLSDIPEKDDFDFIYNPELEQVVPGINDLAEELLAECEGFEFTLMNFSPWLTVAKGPIDGISWHTEGTNENDYSLVYALNDSDAALEFQDSVFEHKYGRAVVFKSDTSHRVQRIENGKRYALAFLIHRREDG